MLAQLINDYEMRIKQLIVENHDLKEFLFEVKTSYLNEIESKQNASHSQDNQEFDDESILNLPFESNYDYLKNFIQNLKFISNNQKNMVNLSNLEIVNKQDSGDLNDSELDF
jgi:hypothetical protein